VTGACRPELLSTPDTVAEDTPALAATCAMVGFSVLIINFLTFNQIFFPGFFSGFL
jgi:hypothetical protein